MAFEKYNPEDKQCGLPLEDTDLVEFCTVKEPTTGHEMSVFTNMEGCQFYTGNFIKGILGKNGVTYNNQDAFCLETQAFPDSPNKKEFPSCILHPGEKYKAKTVYSFTDDAGATARIDSITDNPDPATRSVWPKYVKYSTTIPTNKSYRNSLLTTGETSYEKNDTTGKMVNYIQVGGATNKAVISQIKMDITFMMQQSHYSFY